MTTGKERQTTGKSPIRGRYNVNVPKSQTGFSLIELLVVLTIIALLGAVVGPQVMKHLGRAKADTTRMQIEDLGAALDLYYLDNGRYPDSDEGLNSLMQKQLTYPLSAEKELRPVLEFEMDKQTPFTRDNVYFDYVITHRDTTNDRLHLILYLVLRDVLHKHLAALRFLDLQPDGRNNRLGRLTPRRNIFSPLIENPSLLISIRRMPICVSCLSTTLSPLTMRVLRL